MKISFKKKIFVGVAVLIFITGIFYAGLKVGSVIPQQAGFVSAEEEGEADLSLFWEIVSILRQKHVDGGELTNEKVIEGAIKGVIGQLDDPYTSFLMPADARKFNEDLSGVFGGIGAEISIKEDQLIIVSPLKGNPAETVGLKPNDKVLKVDDRSTEGIDIDEAVKIIRGEPGTIVTLLIMREGWNEPRDFKILRAIVVIPTLDWEMKEGQIAYFRIYNFNANLTSAFTSSAIKTLLYRPKGIIIDLRNNPGGFLEVSTDITGWFVKRGNVILREKFSSEDERYIISSGNGALSYIPTVVLVNEGSASASEILAGALRDLRDVKIVGMKTFGKGSVQELQNLDNGSIIKFSIAEWLTPNGTSINKEGITPDFEIKITEEDLEEGRDPQLEKAMELLKK